jgi:hypothetical protein
MANEMNEWKAYVGRIVLFPGAPVLSPPSALELYRRVWGTDPDNFQKQANPLMPTLAQGTHSGMTTSCMTHPSRIDFSLTPLSPTDEVAQLSFRLIEDTSQLRAELTTITDAIGNGIVSDSVVRVALNVHFLTVKPSPAKANEVLTKIIPAQYGVRITNEEDFIFQINRPYMSRKVEATKVNSITKWSVERLQVLTFAFPMIGAPISAPANAVPPKPLTAAFTGASVTFDINNAPMESPILLSGEQQSLLLREALTTVVQVQRDIGLNVEGFQNDKLSH